jgi:hypothetical protein
MPSVPVQLMLKYDPPMISIVYHFEHKQNERFFHDIQVEKRLLETLNEEDLASHLYVTEAYYFNPKQIKRQQVRLSLPLIAPPHIVDQTPEEAQRGLCDQGSEQAAIAADSHSEQEPRADRAGAKEEELLPEEALHEL